MSGASECCGDAAAYLLAALEPAEADRFRRHAESCAVCREELGVLQAVVDALPLTAPQHPVPGALRRRIMRDVRSDSVSTPQSVRRRRRFQLSPGRYVPHSALAGALASVVALAIFVGLELAGGGSTAARAIRASVTGVPGSAQLRISGGHAELIVNHLSPPPPGRIYELWIKRGNRAPAPTEALFSVTASGAADVGVPGGIGGVSAIMVTAEPAGGSLVPTSAAVIVARLA
jgi:hypothetical protein